MNREQLAIWLEDTLRTFVPLRYRAIRHRYDATYAERTDRFAASTAWQAETEELLQAAGFRAGQSVLDCGCNTGRLLEPLDRLASDYRYVGIDVNEAAIRHCRNRFGAAHDFIHYDGLRLPIADEVMDIVVMNHSVGHVEQPKATLREVWRVLRPGGTVAISTPNRAFKRAMILRNLINGYRPDRTVLRYYSAVALGALLRDAGFVDVRTWRAGESALSLAGRQLDGFRSRLFATARRPKAAGTVRDN